MLHQHGEAERGGAKPDEVSGRDAGDEGQRAPKALDRARATRAAMPRTGRGDGDEIDAGENQKAREFHVVRVPARPHPELASKPSRRDGAASHGGW